MAERVTPDELGRLAPHLRAEILATLRAERRADKARLEALLARQKAVLVVYALPEHQSVLDEHRETLEEFRTALEQPQDEKETIYLRGQIRMLRQVLALPDTLAADVARLEREVAEPLPEDPPEQNRGS